MARRPYPSCAATCPCRTVTADPACLCGFTRCDKGSPYCEVSRLAERAVVSSRSAGGPGLSESDALLQAFDKMAEFHRAEAKRRSGGVGSATADTRPSAESVAQSSVLPASPSPVKVPSKKVRAERRAAREGRAITPAWMLEEDPMVEAIIRGQPDADS
jgi:hypothetical protein